MHKDPISSQEALQEGDIAKNAFLLSSFLALSRYSPSVVALVPCFGCFQAVWTFLSVSELSTLLPDASFGKQEAPKLQSTCFCRYLEKAKLWDCLLDLFCSVLAWWLQSSCENPLGWLHWGSCWKLFNLKHVVGNALHLISCSMRQQHVWKFTGYFRCRSD